MFAVPPGAGEFTLIDDVCRHAAADELQHEVVGFGADEMPQPGAAPAVDPVHAVQPLEHGDTATPGPQQPGQLACAADDERRVVGLVVQVVGDADAAARQPVRQPALKPRRPGDAGDAGDQAQAAGVHSTLSLIIMRQGRECDCRLPCLCRQGRRRWAWAWCGSIRIAASPPAPSPRTTACDEK